MIFSKSGGKSLGEEQYRKWIDREYGSSHSLVTRSESMGMHEPGTTGFQETLGYIRESAITPSARLKGWDSQGTLCLRELLGDNLIKDNYQSLSNL